MISIIDPKNMKILLVEDTTDLLDVISSSLDKDGFVCETANNFSSAHEKLELYTYDIAIIDINLPDGSGLDLIRILKKQNSDTGIIVVSARNSLDNKIEGLELGADDYITKPFEIAELIARIKSLLDAIIFRDQQSLIIVGLSLILIRVR